jgi:tetratricopeptide (TPR) repeat protein
VLLVDDIEWADEESLMLMQYCFERLSEEPIVFVCCLRSDVDGRAAVEHTADLLMAGGRGRRLRLGELSKEEVWRLFDAYEEVSAMRIAEDVRLGLYHVAGGQPFFLVELLRHRSAGQADGSHSNNPLPAPLIAAIRGRLDRLPGSCRRLLQVLSALGQVVDEQLLTDIASADDGNPGVSLECLCRFGFVVRDGVGVRMAQKLVGDVVLASITEAEKRRLHGRIASRIALRGSHSDALVASYFERAGEYERAARHFEVAAAAALAAEAFGAAEQFARYALDFGDSEVKARAASTMMTVLNATRRYSEAQRLLWRFGGAGMSASPIGLHLAMDEDTLRLLADLAEGPLEAPRLLACAELLADPSASNPLNFGHAELFRVIAGHAASWGEPRWWLDFVERFKTRARRCEDDVVAALSLSACTCVEAVFVAVESAERTARIALDRSAASGRRFVEARARAAFGTVALLAGRLEVAAHELRRSHDVAQALGLFGAATAAGNNLAVALIELGRWRAAVDLLTTDLQCLTAHDDLVRRCNLSVAFSEIGNHRLAGHYAETVVGEAKHLGALWAHALGHAVLGGIAFDCGDDVSVRARYCEVVQSLDCFSMAGTDSSYALVFVARWEGHHGRTDAAIERLDQAICSAASKHVLGAMRLQIARAALLGRFDRTDASRSLLELAERAGAMDARSVVARAEAALRSLRDASCAS